MRMPDMKKRVLVLMCIWVGLCYSISAAPLERFPWNIDLDHARELASQQGKPLLIVFRCEP